MDKTALVRSDLEIEGQVLAALSIARVPVSLCQLNYVPQLDEWQLVIATPWYDTRGPRQAYSRVIEILQKAGIYEEVPIRRVFLQSPSDPTVKILEKDIVNKAEGTVHVVRYGQNNHSTYYSVIFTPFAGPGGAVPSRRFVGVEQLRIFLEKDLYISRSSVEEALSELNHKPSTLIFPVQLTRKELRRLGLG